MSLGLVGRKVGMTQLFDAEGNRTAVTVVDVRGNPGGAFQSAIEIAGLFMSDRLATDVVDGNGVDVKFRTFRAAPSAHWL